LSGELKAPGADLVAYLIDIAKADTMMKCEDRVEAQALVERHYGRSSFWWANTSLT
jgi:hypothetical protein